MRTIKKFLKSQLVQSAAAFLLSLYIRFVFHSNRKIRHIHPDAQRYMRGDDNAIFAFWHGRMMLLPAFCPPRRQMRVLISRHRDGSLISQVIGHFGQETVSGSTSKGGKEAASEILKSLKSGDNISITPDGPRGPAQVATKGVVALARMSGRPVLPITFACTRGAHMRSWDRFLLAKPFGRIVFCVGQPMMMPDTTTDAGEESMRLAVEQAMNRLVETAEEMVAHG